MSKKNGLYPGWPPFYEFKKEMVELVNNAMDEKLKPINLEIKTIKDSLVSHIEKTHGGFKRSDAQFKKIDGRFEQIDARFEVITAQLTNHITDTDKKIDNLAVNVDKKIDILTRRVDKTDKKIDILTFKVDQILQRI